MKISDIIEALKKLENEKDYNISIEVEPIITELYGWGKKGKRFIKYRRTIIIEDKKSIEQKS